MVILDEFRITSPDTLWYINPAINLELFTLAFMLFDNSTVRACVCMNEFRFDVVVVRQFSRNVTISVVMSRLQKTNTIVMVECNQLYEQFESVGCGHSMNSRRATRSHCVIRSAPGSVVPCRWIAWFLTRCARLAVVPSDLVDSVSLHCRE